MLSGKIAIAVAIIIGLLLGALVYKDDQNATLNREIGTVTANAKYAEGVADEKDRQSIATAELNEGHYKEVSEWVEKYNVENEKNIKLSINAERDALENPLAFMDDLVSDFIFYDCVRNLGSGILTADNSKACRAEADRTDPASAGLTGTAITPSFREAWTEACDARSAIGEDYSHEEWEEEFTGFTLDMCFMTVAALTPDAISELRRAFAAAIADIKNLHVLIKSQNDIITQLTADKVVPVN